MKKMREWVPPQGGNRKLNLSFKKMKLTLIFTMLVFLTFGNGFSQMKVTLHFEKATIRQVLKTLEDQTGHVFLYKDDIFDPAQKYSVDFTDEPFEEVLKSVCETAGVDYEVRSNRQIILTEKKKERETVTTITLQQRTVTGVVTDQRGLPLPGVTVLLKGTTTGTVTNADGNFSLAIPNNAEILQFSFVGMSTQEVPIEGRTTFTVVMEEETIGIEEVVAIGYGTVRKSDLTGAVAKAPIESIKDYATTGFQQALAGQVAGVQIQQNTGEPGSDAIVRVRGVGSITAGNDPLYVVDGFVGKTNINTINPNDIESIEILKDASAAAIYGSRGSSGVILITTKKGTSDKLKIEANMYAGVQQLSKKTEILNAQEFVELSVEARDNAYLDEGGSLSDPMSSRPSGYRYPEEYKNPSAFGEGTDWQDVIFRTAPIQNYSLSFSGGTDKSTFFISGNYMDQKGIIENSGYKKYSIRLNNDVNIGIFQNTVKVVYKYNECLQKRG